jgi:diguanylate cyclase (GGDEF)-like protein
MSAHKQAATTGAAPARTRNRGRAGTNASCISLTVCMLSLSTLLLTDGSFLGLIAILNIGTSVVIVGLHHTREFGSDNMGRIWRDPAALIVLGVAMVCVIAVRSGAEPMFRSITMLVGATLVVMGALLWLTERLRSHAAEIATEAMIGAVTMSLVAQQTGLTHLAPDLTVPRSIVLVALGMLAMAILIGLAVVGMDGAELVIPLFLLGGVMAGLLGAAVAIYSLDAATPRATLVYIDVAVIALLSVATLARLHPDAVTRRGPTHVMRRSASRQRSLSLIGAVMAGPVLVAVHLAFHIGGSTSTTVTIAGLVSLAASVHVFRLMTRWSAVEHDVYHDSLTGLPNRTLFLDRLNSSIDIARLERRQLALMFIDLDRFKKVNDSLGHAAGNELLCEVAKRLRASVDRSVTVARLSGDEFGVLLPRVLSNAVSETVAGRMLAAFEAPFDLGKRSLYVTPSIGVAHFPYDGHDATMLMEHADVAMYRAKDKGRNTVELYTTDQTRDRAPATRFDIGIALHRAVENEQLTLLYQPKVDIVTNDVVGVEALMRWHDPELGAVPPETFISVAEENGLIDKLGIWALYTACHQSVRWQRDHGLRIPVAVNLSPRQFQTRDVQDLVARVLRDTGLEPQLLELELTESLALEEPDRVRAVLTELKAIGVRFAIDDFGVGYSGLGYLDRFDFDVVKIDKTFVHRISGGSGYIVNAVISLAEGLGLSVVAEGVETREQVEFLRSKGCRYMQGFFFSKAVSGDRLAQMILERRLMAQPSPPVPSRRGSLDRGPEGPTPTRPRLDATRRHG